MTVHPSAALVLGGVRSGKSAFAETLVLEAAAAPVYVATATPFDAGMAERIARHRARRGTRWSLVEEPLDLAPTIARHARSDGAVLVDCLTLWLTNLMLAERDIAREIAGLAEAAPSWPCPVVLVSNEVGLGGVAANAMARRFADHAGLLHTALAAVLPRVALVAAGLPLWLKQPAGPAAVAEAAELTTRSR